MFEVNLRVNHSAGISARGVGGLGAGGGWEADWEEQDRGIRRETK